VHTHIRLVRYAGSVPKQSWRDEPGIAAWSAFLRAHAAAVRHVDAEVRRLTGLPLPWYDVLLELNAAPGRRLRMQDLGEAVVLSRSRVSRIVDELVAAHLVCREPNPDDRRSAYAAITAEGTAQLRRAAPIYLDAIRKHFVAALDSQQVPLVEAAMSAVVDYDSRARR
jgi:DNA-binding MarR family transcriptional regulator